MHINRDVVGGQCCEASGYSVIKASDVGAARKFSEIKSSGDIGGTHVYLEFRTQPWKIKLLHQMAHLFRWQSVDSTPEIQWPCSVVLAQTSWRHHWWRLGFLSWSAIVCPRRKRWPEMASCTRETFGSRGAVRHQGPPRYTTLTTPCTAENCCKTLVVDGCGVWTQYVCFALAVPNFKTLQVVIPWFPFISWRRCVFCRTVHVVVWCCFMSLDVDWLGHWGLRTNGRFSSGVVLHSTTLAFNCRSYVWYTSIQKKVELSRGSYLPTLLDLHCISCTPHLRRVKISECRD